MARTTSPRLISAAGRPSVIAPRAPPHGMQEAVLPKLLDDLDEVVLGNVEGICNALDRDELVRVHGHVDQRAQGVVGVVGQSHGGRAALPQVETFMRGTSYREVAHKMRRFAAGQFVASQIYV